jgi:hypothetical protein
MSESVYRFRPTKSLWEFNELENQEVYCASLGELNDPMEGFKDMFWLGDKIVWMNLLKHYLLCLDRVCIQFLLVGDKQVLQPESMPVFETEDDLPTRRTRIRSKRFTRSFSELQASQSMPTACPLVNALCGETNCGSTYECCTSTH